MISLSEGAVKRVKEFIDTVEDLTLRIGNDFVQRFYSNVLSRIENVGHPFGESLTESDKKALIAFVATL